MSTFGVVNDRYELISILGSGGMGVVYRGRDRVLDREVAVKMIRQELAGEEFVRRFEREAAILARLRSPYIVVVYDYGRHDDKFFLVTDYLADGDLAALLERDGPMSPGTAVPLLADLAEGLADAHNAGVIHRDVKPANVLLWRRGGELRPVLADFGIAVTEDLSFTQTGGVAGSPPFMAPERHLGEPATVATDIYAMGCLLYNLLVGEPPFGGTGFQAAQAHLNDPVPALPVTVPRHTELDVLIALCMAKRPMDRVGSASELARRLRQVDRLLTGSSDAVTLPKGSGASAPETVLTPDPAPPPPARRRRRWPALVAGGVVTAVVAGGVWYAVARGDEPRAQASDEPSTSPSSSGTTEPDRPKAVRWEAASGFREVTIDASAPAATAGVVYSLEWRHPDWEAAPATMTLPTSRPGERACVPLRVVAVAEGATVPGPVTRACGTARAAEVVLRRVAEPCLYDGQYPCDYFDVSLRGFPSRPVDVELTAAGSTGGTASHRVTVGRDGAATVGGHNSSEPPYAWVPGGFTILRTTQAVTVRAGSVEETFQLDDYR